MTIPNCPPTLEWNGRAQIVDKPSVCQRICPTACKSDDLRPAVGTGMHFYVSHRPSIQHGRSTALASSLVALPASLGLLRPVSATGGGLRAPLRFACAVFRACALRVLATSALRAFTFLQAFALQKMPEMTYTPQFAMVVLLRLRACSTPLFIGLTTACFAHCARPSCAPSFLMKALLFRYFVNALWHMPFPGNGHVPICLRRMKAISAPRSKQRP